MNNTTLASIDVATLGNIPSDQVDVPQIGGWTHCLYQTAYTGQKVRSVSAAFRILGFFKSEAEALKRKQYDEDAAAAQNILLGPIRICARGEPVIVIAQQETDMTPKYAKARRAEIMRQEIEEHKLRAQIFMEDQLDRLYDEEQERLREEAKKNGTYTEDMNKPPRSLAKLDRENKYILDFNALPWVKAMRRRFRVDDEILVKRGSAMAAVTDTLAKYRIHAQEELKLDLVAAEKWAADKMKEPRKDDLPAIEDQLKAVASEAGIDEATLERRIIQGNGEFPDALKVSGQGFVLFSYVLDRSRRMEPMVIVYGYCATNDLEKGKQMLNNTVADFVAPLSSNIADMYNWVHPFDLGWFENSPDAVNLETGYTSSKPELAEMQTARREAQKVARQKIEEFKEHARKTEKAVNNTFKVLGITEAIWNDTKKRVGEDVLCETLFSLPSVKTDVQLQRGARDVLMGDIFTANRVLTDADRVVLQQLFGPSMTPDTTDYSAILDDMLAQP